VLSLNIDVPAEYVFAGTDINNENITNILLLVELGVIETDNPVSTREVELVLAVFVFVFCKTCRILPPVSAPKLKLPEPSVFNTCPDVPSAFGSLNATSADVGAEVGELSETTLPPECFSDILLSFIQPPMQLLLFPILQF